MTFPLERAMEHAAACYPMEACGLWIEKQCEGFNSALVFLPCEPSKTAGHFAISPLRWLEAEAAGAIKGIFHVHPDAPPIPSEGDLASIDAWGLPWVIMSWPSKEWAQFEPNEKPQPLLGRTFNYGSHDCFGLIRDYYRRLGVTLPNIERTPLWEQRLPPRPPSSTTIRTAGHLTM
jgi:proteasome lid subunit RPN8/RPN11